MKVYIRSLNVQMEVKNKGIELDIYAPNDTDRLGDLVITRSGLIWCRGKVLRKNGIEASWQDFIDWMES
jgi:hypothetical protein